MAVAAYTHDLTDWIIDSDVTAWTELTNAIAGGAPDEADTESALQGTNTVSQSQNTTGLCSMLRILGASVTLTSGQVALVWHGNGVATAMATYANNGLRVAFSGNAAGDWKSYTVGGSDVPPFPYGKWVNNPVDPSLTADATNGTPPTGGTNIFGIGSMCQLTTAVAKGQPHVCDIIRYGRAQSRFTGGQAAAYGTFGGFATLNDAQTARWGLVQAVAGGYQWKGLMLLGLSTVTTTNRARTTNVATLTTSGAHGFRVGDTLVIAGLGGTGYNATATVASIPTTTTFTYANTGTNEGTTADTGGTLNGWVDFRDSNQTVFIQDTRKVASTFNRIEVRNATTRVDWTGVSLTCVSPSTTASKGQFEVVDNADVNKSGCTFTDMDTFIYLSNSTVLSSTFRRCGQVTLGGATFTSCLFDSSTATSATAASSPANAALVTGSTFVSDGTGHGMTITGTAANMTFTNNTWTGYAASDGSTGNEAVFVNIATGSMNLVISGGTVPSVRTAGATVTVVAGAVSASVKVTTTAGAAIENANVHLTADAGGPFPSNVTVTITNSGTTATVTHTGHGLATNDKVQIKGASLYQNNGVFTITVSDANTYTCTLPSAPGANPTGTIKATFVVLNGLTNVSGDITMSRVFSSAQPVVGWARKSSGSPYYKTAGISGSVSSTLGFSSTVQLISDE